MVSDRGKRQAASGRSRHDSARRYRLICYVVNVETSEYEGLPGRRVLRQRTSESDQACSWLSAHRSNARQVIT